MSGVTVFVYSEFDRPHFSVDDQTLWIRARTGDSSLSISMSLSKKDRDTIRKLFDEMDAPSQDNVGVP